jgi:tetratricopeptide (TPR) repeat protein
MNKRYQNYAINTQVAPPKAVLEATLQNAYTLHQQGQLAQAEILYNQILQLEPTHFDALHLYGVLASQCVKPQLAVDLISKAIQTNPNNAAAYANLGMALQNLNRNEEALANYDLSLLIDPANAQVFFSLGNVLRSLGRNEEAVVCYRRALEINPDYVAALNNQGVVLHYLKRYEESLKSYEQALFIAPDNAEAFYNRGNVLRALNRHEQAVASYDSVLQLRPDHPEVLNNRGNALRALNRLNDALASYQRALQIAPDYADAHWNASLCRLLAGDFDSGWQEYEWRWQSELRNDKRDFAQPLWLGEKSLHNKTILLHAEQGYGDTLQFCRYVSEIRSLGAKIIFEVQPALKRLLSCLSDTATIFARGEALPEFDFHCSLLSLPLAIATNLNTIPADNPYISSDPQLVAGWEKNLGAKTKPRVGLVWSGSAEHENDSNRSIPLPELIKLLGAQAGFYALHKEVRDADRIILQDHADRQKRTDLACSEIVLVDDKLQDFADTAALIALMDIVITVDISVAHLAAAMGKPVWILLPFSPDWRWLLEREDSPWYPTARLFRQAAIGDWAGVVERVKLELQSHFASITSVTQ